MEEYKENIEKVCDTSLTLLGYGFANRNHIVEEIVKNSQTELEAAQAVVRMYLKDTYPNDEKTISQDLFIELSDKLVESRDDFRIFSRYIFKYLKEVENGQS